MSGAPSQSAIAEVRDPHQPVDALLRELRSAGGGLPEQEARHRLETCGPNELRRQGGVGWPRKLGRQLLHPLALLLWLAAALAGVAGTIALAVAIVAVILLNAVFAFIQEQQAERAVEALGRYLPQQAAVTRDGRDLTVAARALVLGDVIRVGEGDRISADARLLDGAVEVDMSALTGESQAVDRLAGQVDASVPLVQASDVILSGTSCLGGQARAVVFATGMRTELGRIAELSQRVGGQESPLERQVRRVAWLIAAVAIGAGAVFFPIGVWVAGMPVAAALGFAIGLLVANVPEGLLPTITLALALGVRGLARVGALVKRLSAVETLGSTGVICTDKTGTLTENRMRVMTVWSAEQLRDAESIDRSALPTPLRLLASTAALCNNATLDPAKPDEATGDPTEIALLRFATELGVRDQTGGQRRGQFRFDPRIRLMSTVDADGEGLWVNTKGAPEEVLNRSAQVLDAQGQPRPLDDQARQHLTETMRQEAGKGLRLLGMARKRVPEAPGERGDAERDLTFLGFVAMLDPPRPEVPDAVAKCHTAGIRIIMITGDHELTAAAIAVQVGIVRGQPTVTNGQQVASMSDEDLKGLLDNAPELVFARISPEAKLRIAACLRAGGAVVAMTGDGVNDAPALREADIGVAMGRIGTDVAREAATMVLIDDNFATIVAAIQAGRQVYDNVRKFIVYIFAHAMPEVVPFLIFALSGGGVPLPLTVLQILAIDLGTETLPALALGREPAEPGLMDRRPRPRTAGVIDAGILVRAWGYLGLVSAALVMGGFFVVLLRAGWHPGAPVGSGTVLHHRYQQATTITFLGIVACQLGTAFASRTDRASLRQVGVFSNRLLLWGILFEVAFAAALVTIPLLQKVFGTAAPDPASLLLLLPFPFVVWGVDEVRRAVIRSRRRPA